jgi:flagellar basal body-associated protein FliL
MTTQPDNNGNELDSNGNEPDSNGNETVERRSRRGLVIGIGVGVVIIMIAAVAAGFFVVRGSESSSLEDGQAAVASGQWSVAEADLDLVLKTQPAFLRQN